MLFLENLLIVSRCISFGISGQVSALSNYYRLHFSFLNIWILFCKVYIMPTSVFFEFYAMLACSFVFFFGVLQNNMVQKTQSLFCCKSWKFSFCWESWVMEKEGSYFKIFVSHLFYFCLWCREGIFAYHSLFLFCLIFYFL